MQDDRDGQTTNGYANTTEVWKVLTRSRFDMWTPRMRGKWLSANRWLFVKEMKLKSSKALEDCLVLSIMIARKMLRKEIHSRQSCHPLPCCGLTNLLYGIPTLHMLAAKCWEWMWDFLGRIITDMTIVIPRFKLFTSNIFAFTSGRIVQKWKDKEYFV